MAASRVTSCSTTGENVVITRSSIVLCAFLVAASAAPVMAQESALPRQKIETVAPPFVHPHEQATSRGPRIIEVRLVTEEKEIVIDDEGTRLQAMSFNGTIPGPLIVVHE